MVKVVFKLKEAWHGHATESLWAEGLGNGEYSLQNSPFFAHGASYLDVVKAKESNGQLIVRKVVRPSGHSTYRVFVLEERDFSQWSQRLQEAGCTYERATEHLYAIDVPPEADVYRTYDILEMGVKEGVWDFEEGHCGHPLRE